MGIFEVKAGGQVPKTLNPPAESEIIRGCELEKRNITLTIFMIACQKFRE